jgi:hypothetical protein
MTNLAEFSKEGYGSKSSAFSMMIMVVVGNVVWCKLHSHN